MIVAFDFNRKRGVICDSGHETDASRRGQPDPDRLPVFAAAARGCGTDRQRACDGRAQGFPTGRGSSQAWRRGPPAFPANLPLKTSWPNPILEA